VEEALFNWQDSQSGFSDCLIVAHNRKLDCRLTGTSDAQAARLPGASKSVARERRLLGRPAGDQGESFPVLNWAQSDSLTKVVSHRHRGA
jgi:hypothetical protein